ncbi:DUF4097 family beta strand repeat-containing protein [Nonomuraea sp. NPDC003804]|uniref:DUF4097 family beta strand repeat-containing protein n=1 Tax=Nonomuraea sp. NPDC003804 TaxID=3154547 RepID=UPI0033A640DD
MRTKGLVALGALVLATTALTGCGSGFMAMSGPADEKTETYEVKDKVAVLDVMSGAGDIVINETGRTGIKVTEKQHWRDHEPETTHEVKGDTLELRYDCARGDSCWVDYTIEVPKGLRIAAEAGSGDVTMRSLTGEVEAKAGSGTIDANNLGGKRVLAETGSGGVELRFTNPPDSVEAQAGSGDVTLYLPNVPYDVVTEVGSGDAQVKVTDDSSSPRKVSVRTGSGDARVLPR